MMRIDAAQLMFADGRGVDTLCAVQTIVLRDVVWWGKTVIVAGRVLDNFSDVPSGVMSLLIPSGASLIINIGFHGVRLT
ncbi:MAG: hypothetical protein Q4A92_07110 [Corynebacterium sp.]|nr:hypothetical protein [Corynebacterium sp.]